MSSLQERIDNISRSVQSNTAINAIVPGTKIHQLIESLSTQNIDIETQIDNYSITNSITKAFGRDLDNIGANLFGIYRKLATVPYTTESMKVLKFYVRIGSFGDINRDGSNQAQSIVIPEGVIIEGSYAGSYFKFRTTKGYTLDANASEQYIAAELVQGDYDVIPSNILTYHNFTMYTQSKSALLLVTNPVGIATGTQAENDASYRYRISKAIKAFPKTTYYGIYDTVITTPGVSDVTILSATSGGGTVSIYVQGVTPITSDEVINDVTLKLQSSLPPWASFTVSKPYCTGLTMTLEVSATMLSEYVRSLIIDHVSSYINNFYGNMFEINRILHIANAAHESVNNVAFGTISTYVGSTDFREISNSIDYSNAANPKIYIRTIDKLIVEPIPNAIVINFVV